MFRALVAKVRIRDYRRWSALELRSLRYYGKRESSMPENEGGTRNKRNESIEPLHLLPPRDEPVLFPRKRDLLRVAYIHIYVYIHDDGARNIRFTIRNQMYALVLPIAFSGNHRSPFRKEKCSGYIYIRANWSVSIPTNPSETLERFGSVRGLIAWTKKLKDDVIAKDAFKSVETTTHFVAFRMPRSTLLLPLWELVVEITKRKESRKKGCTSARLIF